MFSSRSAPKMPQPSTGRPRKPVPQHDDYETQSSVQEHVAVSPSPSDPHHPLRQRIHALNQVLNQALLESALQLESSRGSVARLTQKSHQLRNRQMEMKLFWRHAVDELQASVGYFVVKSNQCYDEQMEKIKVYGHMKLEALEQQLQSVVKAREASTQEIHKTRVILEQGKEQVRQWIETNNKNKHKLIPLTC